MFKPKYIKLNLIKNTNHTNNYLSQLLVEKLKKTDSLKKITWTTKTMENHNNIKPYLSYTINTKNYKLYNFTSIKMFLERIPYDPHSGSKSSIVFNEVI